MPGVVSQSRGRKKLTLPQWTGISWDLAAVAHLSSNIHFSLRKLITEGTFADDGQKQFAHLKRAFSDKLGMRLIRIGC